MSLLHRLVLQTPACAIFSQKAEDPSLGDCEDMNLALARTPTVSSTVLGAGLGDGRELLSVKPPSARHLTSLLAAPVPPASLTHPKSLLMSPQPG
jgi:hypothetical protein